MITTSWPRQCNGDYDLPGPSRAMNNGAEGDIPD